MEKPYIENAMIEVTRRCQLQCSHCLRGNAQKRDQTCENIDAFFSRVSGIGQLTITGGEPSLAAEKILYIVESATAHKVPIESFYIATNAMVVPDLFLKAIMALYMYCDDNENSAVHYSNDAYHDEADERNIKRLSMFSFVSPKYDNEQYHRQGSYEINEGRAKENCIGVRDLRGIESRFFNIEDRIFDDHITSETDVYLNCKGNIICGCDWSFKSQDRKRNIICHVNKLSMDAFYSYFSQFERKAA